MSAEPRARRRFGQNFLVDGGVVDRLVRTIGVRGHDAILEIGPGRGALTERLLAAAGQRRAATQTVWGERLAVPFLCECVVYVSLFDLSAAEFCASAVDR